MESFPESFYPTQKVPKIGLLPKFLSAKNFVRQKFSPPNVLSSENYVFQSITNINTHVRVRWFVLCSLYRTALHQRSYR